METFNILDYRRYSALHDRQSLQITSYRTFGPPAPVQTIARRSVTPTDRPTPDKQPTPKCPHGRSSFRSLPVLKNHKSPSMRKKLAKRSSWGKHFGFLYGKKSQKGPFVDIRGPFFVAFCAL